MDSHSVLPRGLGNSKMNLAMTSVHQSQSYMGSSYTVEIGFVDGDGSSGSPEASRVRGSPSYRTFDAGSFDLTRHGTQVPVQKVRGPQAFAIE